MKLTKRKAFNFLRSYYDVFNELETDRDKLKFITAILDKQFLGTNPTDLKGMARFGYISQVHALDSSVKGYEAKTKIKLTDSNTAPLPTPCQGGSVGGMQAPSVQEEEEVQEKEKGKVQYVIPKPLDFRKYVWQKFTDSYPNREWTEKIKGDVIATYNAWIENDWHDGNGTKIQRWKGKANHLVKRL